jgi:mRNA interferase RelE/StbE
VNYQVEWTRSAAREVRKLPTAVALRIAEGVGELAATPRPAGCRKLAGHANLWRIRFGNYRVIYSVNDRIRVVRVERIADRKDAYK